jgi:hypothetical protein
MLVEVYNDKKNKQFTVVIGATAKAFTCKTMWLDEELYDYESSDIDDFEYIFIEARMLKISGSVCVISSTMIEVLENEE